MIGYFGGEWVGTIGLCRAERTALSHKVLPHLRADGWGSCWRVELGRSEKAVAVVQVVEVGMREGMNEMMRLDKDP
jgi:hypothetical protein